jgi:hypothetical protein
MDGENVTWYPSMIVSVSLELAAILFATCTCRVVAERAATRHDDCDTFSDDFSVSAGGAKLPLGCSFFFLVGKLKRSRKNKTI